MGLLTYFSSSSSRVAFEMPLRDDHVAALDKLLEPATTENVVAVAGKCCWCCDRLRFELLEANGTRFKFPGSQMASFIHGVLLVWEWMSRFFRGWSMLCFKSSRHSSRMGFEQIGFALLHLNVPVERL